MCGEPPEDPLLLFSALYGLWVANYAAFNGDMLSRPCKEVLGTRRKERDNSSAHDWASPYGHFPGSYRETSLKAGRTLIAHLPFMTTPSMVRWQHDFGQDVRVSILSYRSLTLWLLGYPGAALADVEHALM